MDFFAQVGELGFGFLHTHDVGLLAVEPVVKTFGMGGTNSVQVGTDDAHGRLAF